MKKTSLGLLLLAAGINAHAAGEYRATWLGGLYTGTMSYSASPTGPTTSISYNEAAGYWGAAAGPVGTFAKLALAQNTALEQALYKGMTDWAAVHQDYHARVVSGTLTGPITASIKGLTGAQAGKNQITFGGPSFRAVVSASVPGATCQATLTLNHVGVSAIYNPVTGVLDAPAPGFDQLRYDQPAGFDVNCSTVLDFDPLVWLLTDTFTAFVQNYAVIYLHGFQNDAVTKLLPTAPSYLGVDSAIPSGVYKFNTPTGVRDLGQDIKDNWAGYFTGKSFSITLGDTIAEGQPKTTDPGDMTFNNTEFSVNFSDSTRQLKFSVTSADRFHYYWYCPPNTFCGREN